MTTHMHCTSDSPPLLAAAFLALVFGPSLLAMDLPLELPLWEDNPPGEIARHDIDEQVRSPQAPPGSPTGSNRAFSSVSMPTCSIHRPDHVFSKGGHGFGLGTGRGGSTALWPASFAAWLKDTDLIED